MTLFVFVSRVNIYVSDPLLIEFTFIQAPFPLRQLHKIYPFTGPSQSY
jgi:hypothetical protein